MASRTVSVTILDEQHLHSVLHASLSLIAEQVAWIEPCTHAARLQSALWSTVEKYVRQRTAPARQPLYHSFSLFETEKEQPGCRRYAGVEVFAGVGLTSILPPPPAGGLATRELQKRIPRVSS